MATPPKRPREDLEAVTGYIHSVSPIRITNNSTQLFNAVLFCSKGFRGTSDFDVVVNSQADLTVTSVPFVRRQPLTKSFYLFPFFQVNLVEAKVVSITPTTRTINIRGTERELQDCLISDGTDELTLQLWEHHVNAVQMLSSYRFTDLSTRVFKGKVQLTTTLATEVEKIPDLRVSDTAISTPEPAVNSVTGSVYALELRAVMKCSICSNKQDKLDHRTVFHRCQSCNMKQKTATFIKLLSGTLRIQTDSDKHALAVSNAPLVTYLARYNLNHLTLTDELEEHFLALETVSVTFDSDMRVAEITQHAPVVPEDHISEADQHLPAKYAPKDPAGTEQKDS